MDIFMIYKKNVDTASLYAITNKIEYKDEFIKSRNMNIFVIKKVNMSKDEYNELCSRNNGYVLDWRSYETKPLPDSYKSVENVKIMSTVDEEFNTYLNSDQLYPILEKYAREEALAFNTELIHSLNIIGYFDVLKNVSYLPFIENYNKSEVFPLRTDTLGVFLYFYGNTFKKD